MGFPGKPSDTDSVEREDVPMLPLRMLFAHVVVVGMAWRSRKRWQGLCLDCLLVGNSLQTVIFSKY